MKDVICFMCFLFQFYQVSAVARDALSCLQSEKNRTGQFSMIGVCVVVFAARAPAVILKSVTGTHRYDLTFFPDMLSHHNAALSNVLSNTEEGFYFILLVNSGACFFRPSRFLEVAGPIML